MLSTINETQVSKKINITPGVIIGVGPVKFPEYLDRPQMVTKNKEGILKFDEFNRWGESLDLGTSAFDKRGSYSHASGGKIDFVSLESIHCC